VGAAQGGVLGAVVQFLSCKEEKLHRQGHKGREGKEKPHREGRQGREESIIKTKPQGRQGTAPKVAYRNAGSVNGFPLDYNGIFHEQVQPIADVERQVVLMERHGDLLSHAERAPTEIVFDAGLVGALRLCEVVAVQSDSQCPLTTLS